MPEDAVGPEGTVVEAVVPAFQSWPKTACSQSWELSWLLGMAGRGAMGGTASSVRLAETRGPWVRRMGIQLRRHALAETVARVAKAGQERVVMADPPR